MTEIASQEPLPEGGAGARADDASAAEVPAKVAEPWTPQRASEWNAYYDIYVAAFVLLLAFLGSANKIQPIYSGLWSQLQAGREIAAKGGPITTDTSSIAGEGRRWVNVPWLFDLAHYEVFSAVAALAPPAEAGTSPATAAARGDQFAAGALIALDALVRALAAWLLLGLRRKGPGLWWAAICVTLALGVSLSPEPAESFQPGESGEAIRVMRTALGYNIGGIAGPAGVSSQGWGLLFLAAELLLLHHAINLGRAGRIYGLIPLFLLWANVDESFGFGLIVLAAAAVGLTLDRRRKGPVGLDPRPALVVLGASFAATLVNPSHVFGMLAGFGTMFRIVGLDVGPPSPAATSAFGSAFRDLGLAFARSFQLYQAALVGIGLLSFALNRRRFRFDRFLMYLAASALWLLALVFTGPFAVVLAAVLALNGQEWYQDTFGTEGKIGGNWTLWSTGGRLVTIALVFFAIFRWTTGYGGLVGGTQFGFGFNVDDFSFEAADAVRDLPIEGNVLNTTLEQGDSLAWRAAGKRKPYLDSRLHLFPRAVFDDWEALRRNIRDDKRDDVVEKAATTPGWRSVLDAAKVSAVMIQVSGAPRTYTRLMGSPNWVPFHDDGNTVLFGRVDPGAPPADVAYFKANRLDAETLVYSKPRPIPAWERPPTATSELVDGIFQNRLLNRPQPHIDAGRRWLSPAGLAAGVRYLPDPARCIMAIREARTALSIKPDDSNAFRLLIDAYRLLVAQESALMAGIALTPENVPRIVQSASQSRIFGDRARELLTAMNFALQTLPPPKTAADRLERADLNYSLAQLEIQGGSLDLARDHLLAIDTRQGEMSDQFLTSLTRLLGELNQRVEQVQAQVNDLMIQSKASPQDKAGFERQQGAPGMAIRDLDEAEQAGGNLGLIRPTLVDLYCDTGQPDKALDLIGALAIDDPTLSTGFGTATYRQAKVYFLLGNYENAVGLWRDKSIPQVRTQRSLQAPGATLSLLKGEPVVATRMFTELPEKVETQAGWEFEMASAALEGGLPPEFVAEHFQAALKLEPDLATRPIIAYYLGKLGKEVPPPRTRATAPSPSPSPLPTPAPSAPAPAERPELPANPFEPGTPPATTPAPAKPTEGDPLPKYEPPKP